MRRSNDLFSFFFFFSHTQLTSPHVPMMILRIYHFLNQTEKKKKLLNQSKKDKQNHQYRTFKKKNKKKVASKFVGN